MIKKLSIAVIISGRGSNLSAIINNTKNDNFPAIIKLVISNRSDAVGLRLAEEYNIPAIIIDHKKYRDRAEFERELDEKLMSHGIELVCLAGFMRILSSWFVNKWYGKLINIHPSLLPSFRGSAAIATAIASGVRYSGCTTHFVTDEMDAGPIIAQEIVKITADDTEATLAAKILTKEHQLYSETIHLFAEGRLQIEGRKVVVRH